MYTVGIDLTSNQKSKLKKGLPVRVKKGYGCNLIVNPTNYSLVSRAFRKNKGVNIKLNDDEIDMNTQTSPEEQMAIMEQTNQDMASTEIVGAGLNAKKLFSKKRMNSIGKSGIKYGTKALEMALKKAQKENDNRTDGMDGGNIFKKIRKGINKASKSTNQAFNTTGKVLGKAGTQFGDEVKMSATSKKGLLRYLASRTLDEVPEVIGKAAELGVMAYTGNPAAAKAAGKVAKMPAQYGRNTLKDKTGYGLGAGMYAGRGFNSYDDLYAQHVGSSKADMMNARYIHPKLRNRVLGNGMNMINGKGINMTHSHQALDPQPYGANYHFKFFLPPQYQDLQDIVKD